MEFIDYPTILGHFNIAGLKSLHVPKVPLLYKWPLLKKEKKRKKNTIILTPVIYTV